MCALVFGGEGTRKRATVVYRFLFFILFHLLLFIFHFWVGGGGVLMHLFVESSSILYACKIYSFHMNNT